LALGHYVVDGKRPEKPENASAIGFSDSLWSFTQRCWDGKMEMRPKVGEAVTHLRDVAAIWDWLMPPRPRTEDAGSGSEDASDSNEPSEFEILIFP